MAPFSRILTAFPLALAVMLLLSPIFARPGSAQAVAQGDIVPDELLVKFRPGTPASEQATAHRQLTAQVVREIAALEVKVVKVPAGTLEARLEGYLHNPNVEYAEPNFVLHPVAYPNPPSDTLYGKQWNLNNTGQTGGKADADIDAPQAWNVKSGSASIALIDTGVSEQHPDLVGKLTDRANWTWMDSVNGVPNRDAIYDRVGHGTHVAGIAAAASNNDAGIAGVCPDCKLVVAKVCNDDGWCPTDYVANGMLWVVGCDWRDDLGNCLGQVRAKSLNVSLGSPDASVTMQDAVNKVWNRGAVLACAAGNDGSSAKSYPAAYSNCIAVAATNKYDRRASFSSHGGSWVDVAAPGEEIWSSVINANLYEAWNGTSMATPHVAGLAGLLVSKDPSISASSLRKQIESTADRIAGTGTSWAKGRINACRAMAGSGC